MTYADVFTYLETNIYETVSGMNEREAKKYIKTVFGKKAPEVLQMALEWYDAMESGDYDTFMDEYGDLIFEEG